ncbi:MAG: YraN family protein [Opitutaceae bacterium]|nr:YraN family protein [Opitutaceae bacterium]
MPRWWQVVLAWFRRRPDAGTRGEALAADFLRGERGFTVVARNWRNPRDRRDEIDLVCRDGDILVFVEVKTRSADALVPGVYAVNRRKRRVLLRACTAYLRQLRPAPRTFRFDVVEVGLPADASAPPRVLHFANLPLFPKHFRPGA